MVNTPSGARTFATPAMKSSKSSTLATTKLATITFAEPCSATIFSARLAVKNSATVGTPSSSAEATKFNAGSIPKQRNPFSAKNEANKPSLLPISNTRSEATRLVNSMSLGTESRYDLLKIVFTDAGRVRQCL